MGSWFLCGVAGEGARTDVKCRAAMAFAAQGWRLFAAIARLCKCQAVLAGNQTLAAMLFRSEAQDTTQEQ